MPALIFQRDSGLAVCNVVSVRVRVLPYPRHLG